MITNYISYLDDAYEQKKKEQGIQDKRKDFTCYFSMNVVISGSCNTNYIIHKQELTKFLYIKDGCRVYFTDADIIEMLLQIDDEKVLIEIIEALKEYYNETNVINYVLEIQNTKFSIPGIPYKPYTGVFTNRTDISIEYDDLITLLNLVLSKDRVSVDLWGGKQFHKRTICKYITLIMWYKFDDSRAKEILTDIHYPLNKSLREVFSNKKITEEISAKFNDYKLFEKHYKM